MLWVGKKCSNTWIYVRRGVPKPGSATERSEPKHGTGPKESTNTWILVKKLDTYLDLRPTEVNPYLDLGLKSRLLISQINLTLGSHLFVTTDPVSPPACTRLHEADYDVLEN